MSDEGSGSRNVHDWLHTCTNLQCAWRRQGGGSWRRQNSGPSKLSFRLSTVGRTKPWPVGKAPAVLADESVLVKLHPVAAAPAAVAGMLLVIQQATLAAEGVHLCWKAKWDQEGASVYMHQKSLQLRTASRPVGIPQGACKHGVQPVENLTASCARTLRVCTVCVHSAGGLMSVPNGAAGMHAPPCCSVAGYGRMQASGTGFPHFSAPRSA